MAIPGNYLSETTSSIEPNTSGWVAKTNCAIALGTGGRVGAGTLRLISTAAGEMQARTVASYEVTPWTEYEAFADASGATVPERIGIRWLDAASAEISVTWSLTTATASATWHRIAVAGEAPATAVSAQVLVSATPAAGAVSNYFENIYLGLPQRTTGNLLAFNTETMERDASDWHNENNCTLSRQTPMVSWPADVYAVGGQVLAMTVTASADAWCRTSDWPTATPGVEYLGYCYLSPPTAGSVTWVELRFVDSVGATIQTTRATLPVTSTGIYRQRVSDVAPAATDAVYLAAGITAGTAGQVVLIDGAVIKTAPVLREGSVVPYKDASFEQGIGSWTVVSGVATLARLTPWGTDALDGSYCLAVTSATATTSVIRSGKYPVGAAAGQSWTVESGMKVASGGWTLTRSIRWYDAANADLGATSGTPAAVPSPNWWYLSAASTAPAGATQAAVEYTLTATSVSSVLRMDRVALWQSLPLVEVTAVDATASVTVTLRELPIGDTVTVWRVLEDGSRTLVRGPDGLLDAATLASDVLVIEDYEAPLGVAVYYYAETRDSSGVITATRTTGPVTITAGDSNYCWLKDPGNPQRNLRVMVATTPDWSAPIQQAGYQVKGRSNRVTHSDVRGGLEGTLTVWTQTDAEAAGMRWLLGSGNILLWQVTPGVHETDMYVSVAGVGLPRLVPRADEEWRQWTLPLTQSDMPTAVGVAGSAGRTWQDILTEFATWEDVLNAYATWEDVLFNRRL